VAIHDPIMTYFLPVVADDLNWRHRRESDTTKMRSSVSCQRPARQLAVMILIQLHRHSPRWDRNGRFRTNRLDAIRVCPIWAGMPNSKD